MDTVTVRDSRAVDLVQLTALLRLVSPALPVGAYAYSRGLEQAVSVGWVRDEESAARWVLGVLERSVAQLDAPVLARCHTALHAGDLDALQRWTRTLHAFRESAELLMEDQQMGRALLRLLDDLGAPHARALTEQRCYSYVSAFALAGYQAGIELHALVTGFLYASAESQISAAVRLIPLGQTAGQRLLQRAMHVIPGCAERACALPDDELGNLALGQALASAWHETQYSRLFRS